MKKNFFMTMRTFNESVFMLTLKEKFATPIGNFLIAINLKPVVINIFGLITGLLATIFAAKGQFRLAFILFAISGASDAIDGTVARLRKEATLTGAFIDSVFDRYVDLGMLLALGYYYHTLGDSITLIVLFLGVIGSMITSYTAARAASLGVQRNIGFFGRAQRVIALLVGLLFPGLLVYVIWIVAILANVTAIDRVVFYISALVQLDEKKNK